MMHVVFAPGFFTAPTVHTALLEGALVAVLAAVVGVFVILRGTAFGGHALTDVATTGGAGATFVGASALSGFVIGALLGAGAIEATTGRSSQHRDIATGVILGGASGCSALFFYLSATASSTSGATQQILFGSLFSVTSSTLHVSTLFVLLTLAAVASIARPLLLSSLSPDLAAAKGRSPFILGAAFLAIVAITVALCAVASGAILATALLIGPAAIALRTSTSLVGALVRASIVGVVVVAGGVLLSYDSFTWRRNAQPLPVSFFIVALMILIYAVATVKVRRTARRARD